MTGPRTYWQGSMFVADWTLTDLTGDPVTDATVTGEVALPLGGTAPMASAHLGAGVYRLSYTVAAPGTHGYTLAAAGTAVDTTQGTFVAARKVVGLPPITLDPSDDIGMIRLLITDVNEIEPIFEDAQLNALLTMEGGVKRAAAAALEAIARSEVLISKRITTQDLSTDGPAVAAELRASAKALREQAQKDEDDVTSGDQAWAISVADFDPNAAYRTGWW